MKKMFQLQRIFFSLRSTAFWCFLLLPMSLAIGSAVAFFLWSLNGVTQCRFDHPWLLFLLPLAGFGIGVVYHYVGKAAEEGNNLILEQIHQPGGGVPRRIAPLILGATLLTHLFGGSVGREGTAVQMGGSIASTWGRFFSLDSRHTRILLMSGVAAGFGAVFGTPIAGTIFALEVLAIGQIEYEALLPAFFAALVGDWACHAWGINHTLYQLHDALHGKGLLSFYEKPLLFAQVAMIGVAAGLVGRLFSQTTHKLHHAFQKIAPYAPLRPILGGLVIIVLVFFSGTRSYLGLGDWSPNPNDITLTTLFHSDAISYTAWAWKLLFTAVTLACGFKGGEVTPLFFIGAALGNALAGLMGGPTDLFAALGFVAIFAGASNTPLACTIMGIELFGATHALLIAVACFLSYFCSGHSGIYKAQRIAVRKRYH